MRIVTITLTLPAKFPMHLGHVLTVPLDVIIVQVIEIYR